MTAPTWDERVTDALGSTAALAAAIALIVLWAPTGFLLGFGDTWQLIINTTTTIITFVLVVVIQRTQNRNERALHAKLDELIRAFPEADDSFRGLEHER